MKKLIIALLVASAACAFGWSWTAPSVTPMTSESPIATAPIVSTPVTLAFVSVTNGSASAVITPTSGFNILSVSGLTNTANVTYTVAAPSIAGQKVTLYCPTTTSNFVTIADSGTVLLSAAFVSTDSDTLTLQAINTSTWVEVSRSAN